MFKKDVVLKFIGMKNLNHIVEKFIPLDARTDEPHSCNGPESSGTYFPDEIKKKL